MNSTSNNPNRPRRKNSLRLKNFDYSTPRAYFITICVDNGRTTFSDRKLAEMTIEFLRKSKEKNNYRIYAYCLMPDHLHILMNPESANRTVSGLVQTFKSQTSFWYKREYGEPLWQRGFYDHIVRENEDLVRIAQYILDNPIRKGLVERTEDYPYSGRWDDM